MVRARPIRQSPFSFRPVFKLIVHGNNRPKVNVGDAALWGRMHLIPYDFTAENPDHHLNERLAKEKSGILRRLQFGFREWYSLGLNPPERVTEAKQDYKDEVFDDIDSFIEAECEIEVEAETPTKDLHESYEIFCYEKKKRPRTLIAFGRRLTDLGLGSKRTLKQKIRVGIRLKTDSEKTAGDFTNHTCSSYLDDDDDEIM